MTAIEFNHELLGLKDQLFRFANRLTNNREDAKDLLQETLFKAIKSRGSFEDNTNLKAWTHTIMKNTFINNSRRMARQNNIFNEKIDAFSFEADRRSNGGNGYAQKEITVTINKLHDKLKIPFLLHLQGYSYNEIADAQKLRIGTVKSRIFYARRKLKEELKDYSY